MNTITLETVVSQSTGQVATTLGEEVVIMGLGTEEYYALREVGAHIWTLLERPTPVRTILKALLEQYEVEPAHCEADLLAILEDLAREGLIEAC